MYGGVRQRSLYPLVDIMCIWGCEREYPICCPCCLFQLADPMFILRAINHRTGVEDASSKIIVIDLKDKNGATIMIPFIMEQQTKDDKKIMSNLIKSVYGRTTDRKTFTPNDAWYVDKLKKGDALYVNKKRTDHWLAGINTSARTHSGPLVVDSFNLSNIITVETDLSKLK